MKPTPRPRAIVLAYHDVGVRCLRAVVDAGVEVPLVVTHADDPDEHVWFASVARTAAELGLRCIAPTDAHEPDVLEEAAAARPDFVFSFYYRQMLRRPWLELSTRGAYNLHGSLLPRYRGRAPVNWAVLHGERETGATLHVMDEKPDHGPLVDQCAVPILADDTAREVFAKVTVAAEIVVARSLPRLIDGTAVLTPQDLSQGRYFGGRRPDDGRLPATAPTRALHDLVRAVAPPYPGAFIDIGSDRIFIDRTRIATPTLPPPGQRLRLYVAAGRLWLAAADGGTLEVLAARHRGLALDAGRFERQFGASVAAAD